MVAKERNSSIEVLRIIAMILIISAHYMNHGASEFLTANLSFNKILWYTFHTGNLGVHIYILISGYFLCKQKFNVNKFIKLYLQIIFYTLLIFVFFIAFGITKFSISSLLNSIFPITFSPYWFATCYMILLLLYPFFNKLISSLTKTKFKILLIILILLWFVIPTFTNQSLYGNQIIHTTTIYFIGAYIRMYGIAFFEKNKQNLLKILILTIFIYIMIPISLNILGNWKETFLLHSTYFFSRGSILVLLQAIVIFYFFIQKKFYNKIINKISMCTFGVYLIHENFLIRSIIWSKVFNVKKYIVKPYFIIHFVLSVIIVYLVCTIIEYFRIKFFDMFINNKINKISEFINNKLNLYIENDKS